MPVGAEAHLGLVLGNEVTPNGGCTGKGILPKMGLNSVKDS